MAGQATVIVKAHFENRQGIEALRTAYSRLQCMQDETEIYQLQAELGEVLSLLNVVGQEITLIATPAYETAKYPISRN